MIQVASIPTTNSNYKEVIEIRVPIRFYWDEEGFDGIEFGPFEIKLLDWEEDMLKKCCEAIKSSIHAPQEEDDELLT